jgi:hypothetical protein
MDRDSGRAERTPRMRPGAADEEALRLREAGNSYAAVARSLNLKRANDALAATRRALRQRPDDERATLIEHERLRLEQLEARIRGRDKDSPERLERRLAALESLRNGLVG